MPADDHRDMTDDDPRIPPHAVRASASWLLRHLGAQLTADATSATPEAVTAWADGTATPEPAQLARMSWTAATTRLLVTSFGPITARTWLLGDNLDGRAPAIVLREADTATRWRQVSARGPTHQPVDRQPLVSPAPTGRVRAPSPRSGAPGSRRRSRQARRDAGHVGDSLKSRSCATMPRSVMPTPTGRPSTSSTVTGAAGPRPVA